MHYCMYYNITGDFEYFSLSSYMIGPSLWHKQYPTAKGSRQSPIDIVPHQLSHDPSLGPIVPNYDQCTSLNISNNGHSVAVEFDDSDDRSGEKKGSKYNVLHYPQRSHLH